MKRSKKIAPPKDFYESTLDWFNYSNLKKGKKLYEIYPEIPIPKVLKKEEARLLKDKPKFSNKAFVVNMPYGRVVGDKAVISPDNKLLWDVSVEWARWPREHSIFKAKKLPPLKKTKKTIAMLNHPAAGNFYHWMLEALARIHLIQQTQIKIDKYIVNHKSLPFQLETLAACGIAPQQMIQPHKRFHLRAKNLIIPSYVNLPNAWSCQFVRNLLLTQKTMTRVDGYERIYIKRNSYRKVVNEGEIAGILDQYGFKSIALEQIPLKKQIELFYNAQVILSPHGAGLANLTFSKPGTTVIELFSPSFMEPHYWLISRLLNLEYHMLVGQRENPHHYWSGFDNMSVDPQQLSNLLRQLVN